MGVLVTLLKKLNDALKLTSVVVSHDVKEALSIADYAYVISEGKVVEHGKTEDIKNSKSPWVKQFINGESDGPVPFHYDAPELMEDLLRED
jgi:phospholipid/cholesterol/gamma-HCH transport system ATP-binding protein